MCYAKKEPKAETAKKKSNSAIYSTSVSKSKSSKYSISSSANVDQSPLKSKDRTPLKSSKKRSFLKKMRGTPDGSNLAPTQTDTTSQASQTTEETKSTGTVQCECTEHKGQLMLDSIYHLSAHQLFSFLFTQNKLMDAFLVSTKRTDVNCDTWSEMHESTRDKHKRKRTVTYTVELSNSWGPKSSDVKEKQELTEIGNQASDGYFVKKEASNSGVPYADSFNIYCTYCISRISSNTCRMKVYAGVEFKKSVMGMFKGFIERSALGGITEYYKNLDEYLNSNTNHIQNSVRIKAGADFFESSSQASFRSLADSNDGYDSDVDERKEIPKKRLVKSLSYVSPNATTAQSVEIDSSVLDGINQSLRIIAFTLLLLLLIQLWSTFFSTSLPEPSSTSTELLSRLIQHVQSASSLEDVQEVLVDIEKRFLSH